MNRSRIIETYPLSPMQQGMFFHTDYDQPAGFYIQQMVCTLGEDLDVSALHKAWQRVIDRHPIFRTAFRWDVDGPHQEVHESLAVAFQREDWRGKSEEEQTARLHQYLESDRRQGFQPGEPPLMHVALFRWADSAYRMIWTFHHALLDGRSHYLVLREVFTLYEAYRSGHNVELKDPRPYRDYIQWLGQRDGSRDKQFWRQRLEGFCSPSPLVFDGAPVEARPSYHGLPEIRLDKDITFALRSLAKRHDLTLNTLVQGTWALLLSHYSGAGDVIFGATRACRRSTFADAGEMIGMFINTLPVRARVNQGMFLIQWLKDLRQQNIEVRDYEHTPLVKIQNWSELSNTVPLFDSILVFENYEINDSLRARGGTWKNREFRLEEKSNYPVVVAAYAGAELLVKVQYDRKRFTDAAIASVLTQFQTLLGAFLSAPAENLSCGDIMRDLLNRRRKLFTEWKGSRTDFPKDACIHELFAQQAERTPDATAVVFEDYELSYGELNRRANQLGQASKESNQDEVFVFPASFAQQRLWFIDQLEPGNSFYNVPIPVRLKGPLNMTALEQSLNEIVRRHGSLRTTFSTVNGNPVQIIAENSRVSVERFAVPGLGAAQREAQAFSLLMQEAQRSFDLTRGPLIRVALFGLDREEHILLLTIHHIVTDEWSTKILFEELRALYDAFSNGRPSLLSALTLQYADFSEWQREWLRGETLEKQIAYWRETLAGAPAVLDLPTDRPRPPMQTFNGAYYSRALPKRLGDSLNLLSRREGVTLFMTLLAAFQTMLHRYTNQEDIVIGTPIANRTHRGTEDLIGFFVNTLVMRSDLSGNPTFRELLGRVKEISLGAYTHQDLPFEKLVEELNPERSLSHSPLFQVMFALQNAPREAQELRELTITRVPLDSGTSKFELTFFITKTANELSGHLEYNTDLFDEITIARMLDHFEVLLEGIVADPNQRLAELPLLTETERQQLLSEWNDTRVEFPNKDCLHQLFEAQSEKTPDAIALACGNEVLTYNELNARANQLAHYLRKKGVGPEVLVGLCLERSVEMIVSMLGILKAGGAYLPIDPGYPPDRLSFMLKDAEAKVLLTNEHLAERVSSHGAAIVLIDREWETIAHESAQNPGTNCVAENLAYVIYTSGSTGKPKGVLVTHQNVARLFETTDSCFGFNKDDVWTLFHSSAFDFSVWEIWGALLHGGRLVVVSYWVSRAPDDFLELLHREKVTVLNQTPSAFRHLVHAASVSNGKTALALRFIIFGGEALELKRLKRWFDLYGDRKPRLINMYGITETTVHVTYRPVSVPDLDKNSGSVIGNPLGDLQVYLVDRLQQLVPIGVPGEMYIGGAGLSRGYLKRPDLTAERFVPDAFSNVPGARLYRSGDLARYLATGDIEYLGRVDRQIKIRGFRIELGEIEAVLRQSKGLLECAVLANSDSPEQTSLVAYVVLDSVRPPKIEELRSLAKGKLPDYMVPAFFVPLDRIPLTPNGKLDRRALPSPEKARSASADSFVEPRTETEKELAAMWRELLEREQIGIHDNFFELGGHSLLATQIVSRVYDAFHARLSLRTFFEKPTVAALAEFVAGAKKESAETISPIRRLRRDELPPITPDQGQS